MRVGVAGSSGLIGSALVAALLERSDEVIRFLRPTSGEVGKNNIRWNPTRGQVDDTDLRRLGGFDAVVNLAGAGIADHRWSAERKQEILNSRVDSTTLLVRLLSEGSCTTPILVSGSAIGIYGSRGDEILDESSPPGTGFLADVCIRWERAATESSGTGTKVALLRTGLVMSQGGGALKRQLPLFRLGLGGKLSTGRQWLSPISLVDEVRAILWVIDHQIEGPINLTAPSPLTNKNFTRSLARQLHRPDWATVPSPALKLALGAELASEALLASQRVIPAVLTEHGFAFHQPEIDLIFSSVLAGAS